MESVGVECLVSLLNIHVPTHDAQIAPMESNLHLYQPGRTSMSNKPYISIGFKDTTRGARVDSDACRSCMKGSSDTMRNIPLLFFVRSQVRRPEYITDSSKVGPPSPVAACNNGIFLRMLLPDLFTQIASSRGFTIAERSNANVHFSTHTVRSF